MDENSQKPGLDKRGGPGGSGKRFRIIVAVLAALIALALAVIVLMASRLLNSIGRPGELIFEEQEGDILITPSPTPRATLPPTPQPDATPTPSPTPSPTPIPMAELYSQTFLPPQEFALLSEQAADEDYINVLLLGVDRRGSSGNSHTDTMLIATMDTRNGRLILTSLMRDMLVNIPGHGYGKLNSAAVLGGTELLFETINSNLMLDLHEYVLVDFAMFEEVVDRLGGVTVFMSAEEISAANDCIAGLNKQRGVDYLWDGFIFAAEGNVKLTGKQALGYARIRKIDSDFNRTKRQFNLLNHIFAKFMEMDVSTQYELVEAVLPMVETNMTNQRVIQCATEALRMGVPGLLHQRLPIEDTYQSDKYDGKYVILADMPLNAKLMHEFIYSSSERADEVSVLEPGASLPPRTPTIYQGADGNYYYYSNNMPVYSYTQPGFAVTPAPMVPVTPTPTPFDPNANAYAPDIPLG